MIIGRDLMKKIGMIVGFKKKNQYETISSYLCGEPEIIVLIPQ